MSGCQPFWEKSLFLLENTACVASGPSASTAGIAGVGVVDRAVGAVHVHQVVGATAERLDHVADDR